MDINFVTSLAEHSFLSAKISQFLITERKVKGAKSVNGRRHQTAPNHTTSESRKARRAEPFENKNIANRKANCQASGQSLFVGETQNGIRSSNE